MRSDESSQLGLGVRADDADHVDDRLELAGVFDELAGELELCLLDGGALRASLARPPPAR
jgi:hypothetical protein